MAWPLDSATTGCTTRMAAAENCGPASTMRASIRPAAAARNEGSRTGSAPRMLPSSE